MTKRYALFLLGLASVGCSSEPVVLTPAPYAPVPCTPAPEAVEQCADFRDCAEVPCYRVECAATLCVYHWIPGCCPEDGGAP